MDEVVTDSNGLDNSPEKNDQESTERMLPQSEINKIVAGVKREAFEKGIRQAKAEAEANKTQMGGAASTSVHPSLGGMPGLTEDQVRQIIGEESQKQRLKMETERFAADFWNRVNNGKEKYDSSDFENTIRALNIPNAPEFAAAAMASGIDNLPDVLYHLGKNGSQYASLVTLSRMNPALAYSDLNNLSQSLKANDAIQDPSIREPLSQVKRSMVGSDTGVKTIKDLKRLPAFRG